MLSVRASILIAECCRIGPVRVLPGHLHARESAMMCKHILNWSPAGVRAARWTGVEMKLLMLIRIMSTRKNLSPPGKTEKPGFIAAPVRYAAACYADRKVSPRMLFGSILLLLGLTGMMD